MSRVRKYNVEFKEGDWYCLVCKNLNFGRRKECNKCKADTTNVKSVPAK